MPFETSALIHLDNLKVILILLNGQLLVTCSFAEKDVSKRFGFVSVMNQFLR